MKGLLFVNTLYLLGLATAASATPVSHNETKCVQYYARESSPSKENIRAAIEQKSLYAKDYNNTPDDVLGSDILNRLDALTKNLKSNRTPKPLSAEKLNGIAIIKSLLKSITESKTEKTFINRNDIEGLEDFILKFTDVLEGKKKESITSFNDLGQAIINEYKTHKPNLTIHESFNRAFETIFGKEESEVRKAKLRFCK